MDHRTCAKKKQCLEKAMGNQVEDPGAKATDAAASSLEVLIGRLRKRLGADVIRTSRGEGYAFETDA